MSDKIILTKKQRTKIEKHTLKCYPEEMCGFLTKADFIPVQNTAEDREKSFKIDAIDFAKHHDEIIAIVHSHTRPLKQAEVFDLRAPSYQDYLNQKLTNRPWLIVGCESITVTDPIQFPRIPSNEYVGRRFQWFLNDCYNLVQDYYLHECGIVLPDARHKNNLFDAYFEQYGFVEITVDQIQENDLIIIDQGGYKANHLGIYTQGKILHQAMVSALVPFETFIGRIHKVLRYVKP
jgi:proteasome lid subunit RPN8/RPN11